MPTGYPVLNNKQKEEIIHRIKENGEKVTDLAKEYGTYPKTIYGLLNKQVNQPNIALELARVKRAGIWGLLALLYIISLNCRLRI